MVPGAASLLVLVKLQSTAVQLEVKLAVGAGLPEATVIVWVLVLLSPSASFTVRLTLYCLASGNWKEAVAVLASSCPSPSKSQLQLVTATSSVLLLTKVQAPPVEQDGRSKRATGAVLSGGGVPAPSLQAEASTRVPVTTASRPIDRIECSQLRSCPKGADMRRMSQSRASRPGRLHRPCRERND